MARIIEQIEIEVDGQLMTVARLDDGTFIKPNYLQAAEREPDNYTGANGLNAVYGTNMGGGVTLQRGKPATPEAQQWEGWGTALKPACEPIIVARKPLSEPNVAANVLTHGTGAINIDGCRIETSDNLNGGAYAKDGTERHDGYENWRFKREGGAGEFQQPAGRWPANVILGCACEVEHEEGCAVRMLDEQSGEKVSRWGGAAKGIGGGGIWQRSSGVPAGDCYSDSGGASRFFYCAKANKDERRGGAHPTVKPISLMRYLVRLVTPKGGRVLDPFAGTYKTGEACVIEGFDFTGVDLGEQNCETGRLRMMRASGKPVDLPRFSTKHIETPLFG